MIHLCENLLGSAMCPTRFCPCGCILCTCCIVSFCFSYHFGPPAYEARFLSAGCDLGYADACPLVPGGCIVMTAAP